ncbi:MAG: spore coat associated protein CotJA [Bacillota bacterium]|nr:spore coat associated protein CotJA [Bacillota bacterium]
MFELNCNRFQLAMAYVPMQPWEEPYDPCMGLQAGTIFPSLLFPFEGGGC